MSHEMPEHVCGLEGYNGMIDPPCPACARRGVSMEEDIISIDEDGRVSSKGPRSALDLAGLNRSAASPPAAETVPIETEWWRPSDRWSRSPTTSPPAADIGLREEVEKLCYKWLEISGRPNRPTGFRICADELLELLSRVSGQPPPRGSDEPRDA